MTLAMASGTLVPAARNVIPIMESDIPNVKPTRTTCKTQDMTANEKSHSTAFTKFQSYTLFFQKETIIALPSKP